MTGSVHPLGELARPTLRKVWQDPAVRQRIIEYLGGRYLSEATCTFLGSLDAANPSRFKRHPPHALDRILDSGQDIARSLEDRISMLVHLDIEYVNFDNPAAAYLDAPRIFRLQEPLVEAIEARLLAFGIRYLHLITGQGHHFVWRVPKESPVAQSIAALGICTPADGSSSVADPMFQHLALLMEHFAHLVKRDAASHCEVPVEITAQHVGPGASGAREMLSIDLSEYGDPLHSRMIRIPYTIYQKPCLSGLIGHGHQRVSEFFTLPLHEMGLAQLLLDRQCPEKILALARRAGVRIPVHDRGTERLMDDYLKSDLCVFHRKFYAIAQGHPELSPQNDDQALLDLLPPCAVHVLTEPNDWLLKPSGMQLVTRCLLALGWHPRHIAGLIRSKFANPAHGWDETWRQYDPTLRAEFYVRLFSGQIATGLDRGIDFNCVSQQEKQFCWNPCGCSLDPFRSQLHATFNPNPSPS